MGSIHASKTQEVVSMDVGVSKMISTTFQPHKLRAILNITSSCRRNRFSSKLPSKVLFMSISVWRMGRHVPEDMPQGEGRASRVVAEVFRLETQGMPSGTCLSQCKHLRSFSTQYYLPSMDTPSTKRKYKTEVTSKHWRHILHGETCWNTKGKTCRYLQV